MLTFMSTITQPLKIKNGSIGLKKKSSIDNPSKTYIRKGSLHEMLNNEEVFRKITNQSFGEKRKNNLSP